MLFDWNKEKNNILKKERDISFEEIVICINENKVIQILYHPNKKKYPNQRMYLINYRGYVYVVPFVENKEKEEIFLKTIYPSRFYTKLYLKGEK